MAISNKKKLETFSIKQIKDYGGCPDAARLLFARYKDETDNLLKRKKDIVNLILMDNKPDWAINFLASLVDTNHKIKFFEKVFNDCVYNSGDKDYSYTSLKVFKAVKDSKLDEAKTLLKKLEPQRALDNDSFRLSNNQKAFIRLSIYKILIALISDEQREFTRSLVLSFQKMAEIEAIILNCSYDLYLQNVALNFVDSITDWIE